ncbi:MAG TPA: DUF4239 domain-containing protein [Acetobacteraceae bacterium]|nr:DUF4239 domain-containing protein [Acetobacteraceae bacterium]
MKPDVVYEYPIWAVVVSLVGAAVLGAVTLELCARRLLPLELRRQHNDVAAAIFSIIGVTYAVLLAFVAMLALEGFNKAKAASYAEAAVIRDVYNLSVGFAEPERSSIRNKVRGYARLVVTVEWPEQAAGRTVDQDSVFLDELNQMAFGLRTAAEADRDLHSLLLQAIERLWDARQERLLAAQSTIPDIVWFVVIAGGALTVAFGSFLGAPSLGMQLAMSAVLGASGALVLILIIALSNPFRGDFRVSTAPFEHVLTRMEGVGTQH